MAEHNRKNLERIRYLLHTQDSSLSLEAIDSIGIEDIAEVMNDLSRHEQIQLFLITPEEQQPELFSHLASDLQKFLIESLESNQVDSIFNEMEPVDRTQFLEELDPSVSHSIIERLDPNERKMAWQLLSYPEDSVGRLMSPEFIALSSESLVKDAIDELRWSGDKYDKKNIHNIFVVDQYGRFMGEVSLIELITCDPPTRKLIEILEETGPTLSVTKDQTVAVDYFRKYDRLSFAVTDNEEKVVGVVYAENMFDAAEEEATEDIQQFGGQATLEDSYFSTSFITLIRKRAGWLSLLFVGEIYTTNVLQSYDSTIADMRFIVYFLPLIISSGGNSGSQAASLIIRGLAVREMSLHDWSRVFWRELLMGVCLGAILGLMGLAKVFFWNQGLKIALIVSLSLVGIVILGAVIGAMLPFVLKRLRIDPAVSSSPFVASLVDIFGIMVLFQIAITINHHWSKISTFFGSL